MAGDRNNRLPYFHILVMESNSPELFLTGFKNFKFNYAEISYAELSYVELSHIEFGNTERVLISPGAGMVRVLVLPPVMTSDYNPTITGDIHLYLFSHNEI